MNKKNIRYPFVLFFIFFLCTTGCGGSPFAKKATRTSYDDTIRSLIETPDDQEAMVAMDQSARMDGVEFYINQDLMRRGSPVQKTKVRHEFPELRSAFDQPVKIWNPDRTYNIPMVHNEKVDRWVKTFTGPLRSHFTKWLRRGSQYVPMMEEILQKNKVPTDIIYLSMIESGFNTQAYSSAHAAGLWQFIRSTGNLYGLKVDHFIDERRDIVKSTDAAARHLKDLYQMYGDWYLAFAAYNAGAGKVNQAIRRGHTKDYWSLSSRHSRLLRQETKDYVPRILAAAYIVKNYKKFNFSPSLFEKPLQVDIVSVPDATDLSVIAGAADSSVEEIQFLNPSLKLGVSPPHKKYSVLIPAGKEQIFHENYSRIPASERVKYIFHRVGRRETIGTLAKQYGIASESIASANQLSSREHLVAGSVVMIPHDGKNFHQLMARASASSYTGHSGNTVIHRVRSGDTLDKIARRYGVRVSSLKAWNHLGSHTLIKPGQKLKVRPAHEVAVRNKEVVAQKSVETVEQAIGQSTSTNFKQSDQVYRVKRGDTVGKHFVKRGDTLAGIAKQHGVRVASLQEWNRLGSSTSIKTGQVLKLLADEAVVQSFSKPDHITQVSSPTIDSNQALSVPEKSPTINNSPTIHLVQKGETLWHISRKYGVTINQLKQWNELSNNRLDFKQKIKIYPASTANQAGDVALVEK